MSLRLKILSVTGSRAEFGLLRPLLTRINNDPDLDMCLIVTGAHLMEKYGMTVQEIDLSGLPVAEKIELPITDDTPLTIAQSVGAGVSKFAEVFHKYSPDYLVVVGDRYEILAAAEAAFLLGIPIAHIHGGEVTEGAMDESIRHAITKISHVHFTAATQYARRVIQLGEDPERVFIVGPLAIDGLKDVKSISKEQLESDLGVQFKEKLFVVTYHPVTRRKGADADVVHEMIAAIDQFPDTTVIVTGVNADAGNVAIRRVFQEYAESRAGYVSVHESLGHERYLNLIKIADIVIGNSSSGIIEAPLVGTPTVNIGERQKGRLREPSVIDCNEQMDDIYNGISQAINSEFRSKIIKRLEKSPSEAIIEQLKSIPRETLLTKPFFDLDFTCQDLS
jgi:UDP-N-acetylglucosamine 2-epimerase (non-hydrolysing)/GDP/UDP-N,N'-diacetylbacillosamine 2-epimerase (hydrolysing)